MNTAPRCAEYAAGSPEQSYTAMFMVPPDMDAAAWTRLVTEVEARVIPAYVKAKAEMLRDIGFWESIVVRSRVAHVSGGEIFDSVCTALAATAGVVRITAVMSVSRDAWARIGRITPDEHEWRPLEGADFHDDWKRKERACG